MKLYMGHIDTCHWVITKKCNLECIHCIASVGNKLELNTTKALQVIDKLKDLGCKRLYITGGEPLIRNDIFEIVKKAKKYKIIVSLITNATLINKTNIKQIKSYIDELGISLDGSSSRVNDKIRGENTFRRIIKSILLIQKYRIPLTLYTTVSQLNLTDIKDIIKLATALKINSIKLNEVSLLGRAYKNRRILSFSKANKLKLKDQLIKILFRPDAKILYSTHCSIDPKMIVISPTGYVYPCIEIFQRSPSYHFGNILRFNKKEIEHYRQFIQASKNIECPYEDIRYGYRSICLNNIDLLRCPLIMQLYYVGKN